MTGQVSSYPIQPFQPINPRIMNPTDLTQHPPRSPRVRLGGFVILPRMLDKGRATIAGTTGEYRYACPLDQRFLDFAGIDPEASRTQLAEGKGDGGNPRLGPRKLEDQADRDRH